MTNLSISTTNTNRFFYKAVDNQKNMFNNKYITYSDVLNKLWD